MNAMRPAHTITLSGETLESAARTLRDDGGRMQMAYAWQPRPGAIELLYLCNAPKDGAFQIWRCSPAAEPPSLAAIWPALGWYEREIMDLFGVSFRNHPQPNRLVLGDGFAPPFDGRSPGQAAPRDADVPHALPDLEAPGVQVLPFGPVRADVVESAEFMFFYVGERILHYHPLLFFKHRGMEARFAGLDPLRGVVVAERVSGVGSVAHALAYCQAIEAASGCEPPVRARWLRVLLAELERLYNHLHYLGALADTTTLKVGQAEGRLLEEQAKQINARLTGSRFLRGLLVPGGLRRDLAPDLRLRESIVRLHAASGRYLKLLSRSDSFLDRLITTGPLSRRVALDQGATGPVLRASGIDRDLRRDHPYAAYSQLPPEVPVRPEGDAHARFLVRAAEIDGSLSIIRHALQKLPEGPVRTNCVAPAGAEGLGWAESPRGTLFYAIHIGSDGRLARVKVKSPSFSNWRVFPYTVHDSNMMDYAINEASFGLTVSGCAR